MKKIAAICGSGLGSSFMVEMNIKSVLNELGEKDIDVEHMDLGSAWPGVADIIVCGKDLEDNCKRFGEVLALDNIFDKEELRNKLKALIKK
ncbi:MAG TPA: PTS lactose transporter subunit IIB [Eubacteriaceae bacterium]|nr:PTS lactose transporter subunit IIB [Eubacteriaceae bacterium]